MTNYPEAETPPCTEARPTPCGRFIETGEDRCARLASNHGDDPIYHLFDKEQEQIKAINTAIACGRPLLLTGDPGVGKTQLARAAARALRRCFVRHTVDAKTESRDLLWQLDVVARLAQAQLASTLVWSKIRCKRELAKHRFLQPGPLWWGLNWESAKALPASAAPEQRDGGQAKNGVVVLIDEIDKAEIDVPNGLLEVLGEASFQPEGLDQPVRCAGPLPLVVITSNGERALPAPFVRRCVLFKVELAADEEGLRRQLVARGQAHTGLGEDVLKEAFKWFYQDLETAIKENWRYKPGQAEYLDFVHALKELASDERPAKDLLKEVAPYILCKDRYLR